MKLGIIGNGFVGGAIYENLKGKYSFMIYDRDPVRANCESVREVTTEADVIFVALPTPMHLDGTCDLSIIFDSMSEIYENYNDNIIILKSTVLPGTCRKVLDRFPRMRIVFSPEFLTEANHVEDFKNSNRMIFGGKEEDTAECVKLLQKVFPNKYYFTTDHMTAEMVKYFINTFLATKVSFANEMSQVCESASVDYEKVVKLALYDERIGKSHLSVPGPDGFSGFGGKCFPKDLNAMIKYAEISGISPTILSAAWKKNLEVREEQDWLHIDGAVSKGETK